MHRKRPSTKGHAATQASVSYTLIHSLSALVVDGYGSCAQLFTRDDDVRRMQEDSKQIG